MPDLPSQDPRMPPAAAVSLPAQTTLEALLERTRMVRLADELPAHVLDAVPGRTRLQVQLLHNRGIVGPETIAAFLARGWRASEPERVPLPGLAAAVARLRQAIKRGERIAVCGDYDTDGMTSCAILTLALRVLGAAPESYVPRRDDDGRGLNPDAVRMLASRGVRLLVTTDGGMGNAAETTLAHELGMDVIVTDHHPPHEALPEALAIVNPQLAASPGERGDLSGAGVAFRVAEALLAPAGEDAHLEELLDLVAVGTIADVVPLTAESWALARAGLRRLQSAPRPGLRALLDLAGIAPSETTERDISFALAPRLNAAARLGQPELALDLLLTAERLRARDLALRLDALNAERQRQLDVLLEDAQAQVQRQLAIEGASPVLIVQGEGWALGILGLVASRLAEELGRTAFAISLGMEECRGSGRGPEGSHLGEMLRARSDLFKRFGGHQRAAGFTIARANLEELLRYLRAQGAAAPLAGTQDGEAALHADCRLTLRHLDLEHYQAIRALAPFGPSFEEPVFVCRGMRIVRCWRSGADGRTLRLLLRDASGERVALWSRHGLWCDQLQAAIAAGTLPHLDAVVTLGAYHVRGESDLRVTPRIVALVKS
jgi:single-stranded-DNA-specific exonuclease